MLKKQIKTEEITKVIERLQRDLSFAMKNFHGAVTTEIAVLTAYLVYKVRVHKKIQNSYDYITSNECTQSDNLRAMIDTYFSRQIWDDLMTRVGEDKYTNEQLLAVVYDDSQLYKITRDRVSNTPKSLIELALQILDINDGETVGDICSGLGSFMAAGIENNHKCQITGYEKNTYFANSSEMRLDLVDDEGKAEKLANLDETGKSNGTVTVENIDAMELFKKSHRIKFDKIFSNYPFGMKMHTMSANEQVLKLLTGKYKGMKTTTSSDWIYNTLVSELLAKKGKAVCIMSRGSTWNSQDRGMRQYFVENGLIECVISLPAKMFLDTNIETSMIVISHGNSTSVPIVDGSKLFVKGRRINQFSQENIKEIMRGVKGESEIGRVIDYEMLKENDFTLNLTRYLKDTIEFENGVAFKEVIKDIKRGAPLKASELDKMTTTEKTYVQYLMLSNVQDGEIVWPLPYLRDVDPKYEKYCLKDRDFIISRNNSPYKVGVAEIEDDVKVIANGNMFVVTLDEQKVDPYYILAFFNSQAGNLALKSISVGTVITNISIKDLKELRVPMPSMDVQQKIGSMYKEKMTQVKEMRGKLAEAEKELREVFDSQM